MRKRLARKILNHPDRYHPHQIAKAETKARHRVKNHAK